MFSLISERFLRPILSRRVQQSPDRYAARTADFDLDVHSA
jgi:hypothetical protein